MPKEAELEARIVELEKLYEKTQVDAVEDLASILRVMVKVHNRLDQLEGKIGVRAEDAGGVPKSLECVIESLLDCMHEAARGNS
jgi:hypothetical protein